MKPERFAINALGDKRRFLAPLFVTPDIGMAVLDNRFRFQVVNHVLAATNGIPVKAHIGKTVRHVLGPIAEEVEPRLRRAFATGRSEIFETIVKMPTRSQIGHWIQTYIPLRDPTGNTAQVCAIVLEVTEKKRLEELLFGLTGKLLYLHANLSRSLDDLSGSTLHRIGGVSQMTHSLELVHRSTAELIEVLKTLKPSASPRSRQLSTDSQPLTASRIRMMPVTSKDNLFIGHLSAREHEVMRLLAENQSNKQIGVSLGISVRTVEAHRRRIMEKLDLHSVGELIHLAIRNGIVEA
jgi:DNA-binding CsgD family transcriptional regulator